MPCSDFDIAAITTLTKVSFQILAAAASYTLHAVTFAFKTPSCICQAAALSLHVNRYSRGMQPQRHGPFPHRNSCAIESILHVKNNTALKQTCTCVNCKATKQRTETLQSQSSCSFIRLILLVWQGAKLQIPSQADPAALVYNVALLTFHNTI